MNAQGSFWATFKEDLGDKTIEDVLNNPNVKIEEVLDHSDLLQECKSGNSELMKYFMNESNLRALLRYITMPPPAEPAASAPRYPYLASEVLSCNDLLPHWEHLFTQPELLKTELFSFLDQTTPIDPSHAVYFRKVLMFVIEKRYTLAQSFIRTHHLFDKLFRHLYMFAMAELLMMLLWDESMERVLQVQWLLEDDIIQKLVECIHPRHDAVPDLQINSARVLVDLVSKLCAAWAAPVAATDALEEKRADSLQQLASALTSPTVLDALFGYMKSESHAACVNSLWLLVVLVQRESEAQHKAGGPVPGGSPLLDRLAADLPALWPIITAAPTSELPLQYGTLRPPLGLQRMRCAELTVVCLRVHHAQLWEALVTARAIPTIMDWSFVYEWNNLLHGLAQSLFVSVFDSGSPMLRASLLTDGKFLEQCLALYERNESALQQPKGSRLGNLAHTLFMLTTLGDWAARDANVQSFIEADSKAWDQLQAHIQSESERQSRQIGGERPRFGRQMNQSDDFDSIFQGVGEQLLSADITDALQDGNTYQFHNDDEDVGISFSATGFADGDDWAGSGPAYDWATFSEADFASVESAGAAGATSDDIEAASSSPPSSSSSLSSHGSPVRPSTAAGERPRAAGVSPSSHLPYTPPHSSPATGAAPFPLEDDAFEVPVGSEAAAARLVALADHTWEGFDEDAAVLVDPAAATATATATAATSSSAITSPAAAAAAAEEEEEEVVAASSTTTISSSEAPGPAPEGWATF